MYQEKIKEWQELYIEKLVKEYADYLCGEIPASTKFWELEKRIKQDIGERDGEDGGRLSRKVLKGKSFTGFLR